jgi:hypothetical protein
MNTGTVNDESPLSSHPNVTPQIHAKTNKQVTRGLHMDIVLVRVLMELLVLKLTERWNEKPNHNF